MQQHTSPILPMPTWAGDGTQPHPSWFSARGGDRRELGASCTSGTGAASACEAGFPSRLRRARWCRGHGASWCGCRRRSTSSRTSAPTAAWPSAASATELNGHAATGGLAERRPARCRAVLKRRPADRGRRQRRASRQLQHERGAASSGVVRVRRSVASRLTPGRLRLGRAHRDAAGAGGACARCVRRPARASCMHRPSSACSRLADLAAARWCGRTMRTSHEARGRVRRPRRCRARAWWEPVPDDRSAARATGQPRSA